MGKKTITKICGGAGIILCILMLCILSVPTAAYASDTSEKMTIEQARIYMPDIRVYYYPGSSLTDGVTASLSDQKLTVVNSYPYSEDKNGTDYYILVDVSLSISKDYFADIRQALISFPDGMKDKDTLSVLTFGDQVNVVLDKEKKADTIKSTLEGLDNNDMNTHLFEALNKTAELADKEENIEKRSVALVISDGEDCSTNESTRNEALEGLQKAGIPLYAMAVRETAHGEANAFIEAFSDFVRAANGQLSVFGLGEAQTCMQNIQNRLNSVQVLELKAPSNRITSVMQPLTLVASGAGSESLQVCPRYNKKDTEAPSASVKQISEKELRVVYSEPVKNAEDTANYKVTCDGEVVPVYTVDYREKKKAAAVLTFREPLEDGDYIVEFQGISDNSMEENMISQNAQLHIGPGGENAEEPETEPDTDTDSEEGNGIPAVGIVLTAVLLIGIAAALAFFMIKRKKSEEEPSLDESRLRLTIKSDEEEKTKEVVIRDRLIFGRSSECDIAVIDKLLSRRHFMIEKEDGLFYISDLDSMNGTMLNGIRITARCRLKNGDVVQAGSLFIIINW